MFSTGEFIVAPTDIRVEFKVNPVNVLINSLMLIHFHEDNDGIHQWVGETANHLTSQQKQNLKLLACVVDAMGSAGDHDVDFPTFIANLAQVDAAVLQHGAVKWMQDYAGCPAEETLLADETQFIETVRNIYVEKHKEKLEYVFDESVWREAYRLLNEPENLRSFLHDFLQEMWEHYLAKEWKRTVQMLQDSVQAYSKKSYSGMGVMEIIEAVTGRDLRSNETLEEYAPSIRRLLFMPSPHLGPYVSWRPNKETGECIMMFGARLPKDADVTSSALNRSELMVWLNALADDTRLRMLEMLMEREEICAQEFIDVLELSQSSASRHLRQLAASGFLTVRRKDVAKCYGLNRERVEETMKALGRLVGK